MSDSGQGTDCRGDGKRGNSTVSAVPASPSFIVNMSSTGPSFTPSTPPSRMNNSNSTLVGSPDRIDGNGSPFSGSPASQFKTFTTTATATPPHEHHHREPSIVERFGRRHGQDWPPSGRCSSSPGSRSESRSKSRGGMRRTSGIHYNVIPVKPVMGPEVFQTARKTEKEIDAMKGAKVREYYRSLV